MTVENNIRQKRIGQLEAANKELSAELAKKQKSDPGDDNPV